MAVEWGRYADAYRAIHDAVAEKSLSVFDSDLNFGEALRLVRYKGELYVVISPLGQVWRLDSVNWKKVYDVAKEQGANPINPGNVYSKWCFTSWDAIHWSKDDRLYFVGCHFPTGVAVLRYSKTTNTWEFFKLNTQVGTGEFLSVEEFGDYLYAGRDGGGDVWRSGDGENWTKVFNGVPGYPYAHSLAAGGSPNKLRVGLNSEENGNPTLNGGKVYVTTNGTDWSEELDVPSAYGGVSALGFGGGVGGDYCLAGTNLGFIYLWDGGYQSWRCVGKVGLPVLDIRQHAHAHRFPEWLITCGSRWKGGAIWRFYGRLLQVFRTYSHAIFSHETLNGELLYSWGWADSSATTHVRGHYAGVKKIRETLLDYLMRQNPTPYDDGNSVTTTDVAQSLIRFNLGAWRNRVLQLRNTGGNPFAYRVYASFNGVDYINIGEGSESSRLDIDFSESPFAVIWIEAWSANTGQHTTVEGTVSCW